MRYILLIFLISFGLNKGNLVGEYSGKSIRYYYSKNIGKINKKKAVFNNHKLILKPDSTFIYEFEKNTDRWTVSFEKKRRSTGSWKSIGDTVILNSYYKGSDYFNVIEEKSENLPDSLIQIKVNNTTIPYGLGTRALITINNELSVTIDHTDSLILEKKEIESIKINVLPIVFEYCFTPRNELSNKFTINYCTNINNEDYFLENWKLVLMKNKLEPLEPIKEFYGFKKE